MELHDKFVSAFKTMARIFPDDAPVQRLYAGRNALMPGDIASFLIELEHLKIYENLENFAVFSRFVSDFGIRLFQAEFIFSTRYQFRLSEDEQRQCYEVFKDFAEMNDLMTDDYLAQKVFPGWETLLENETLKMFRSGVKTMETNFVNNSAGEDYLLAIVDRVKNALGVRFALGIRDGTLTLLDAKDRLESEFTKNPFDLDDTTGKNILEAMFENDQIREGIDQVAPMLGKLDGVTGKQKKMVMKKLKSKDGENMIRNAMKSRTDGNKQFRTATDIFLTIVIDKIIHRLPQETRAATRTILHRKANDIGRRLALDAEQMSGNFVKNVTDLSVIAAKTAEDYATNAPNSNMTDTGRLTRKTTRFYLQSAGFARAPLRLILNEAYGKPNKPTKRGRKKTKSRRRR